MQDVRRTAPTQAPQAEATNEILGGEGSGRQLLQASSLNAVSKSGMKAPLLDPN
jgi:hypothetical protein